MFRKTLLSVTLGALFISSNAMAATGSIKDLSPNQYDCTVDELELFVMKRTENLRKESTITTWEDFKKVAQAKKSNPSPSAADSPSNGTAASEVARSVNPPTPTGSASGEEEDDCPLFFSELGDVDMSGMEMPGFDDMMGMFEGGLDNLTKAASEQMEQLTDSLMNVLKEGMCERLSTEYLTELGTDVLDDVLKEEIGYTTDDIEDGGFANEVVNDQLKEEFGTSDAKLLNVMDEDLNDNREKYMEKQYDSKLDEIEDGAVDKATGKD